MSIAQVLPMLEIDVPGRRFGMHAPNSCLVRLQMVKWLGIRKRTDTCDFLVTSLLPLSANKQKSPPQTVFPSYKAVKLTTFKANLEGIKLSMSPCNLSSSRMNTSVGYIPTATSGSD
jgi:hypothetical protein